MNKKSLLYQFIEVLYLKKIVKIFKNKIYIKDVKISLREYIILIQTLTNYFIYDIFFYIYLILYSSKTYAL